MRWHEFIREASVTLIEVYLFSNVKASVIYWDWLSLQVGTIYMQVFCKVQCSILTRATICDRTFHTHVLFGLARVKYFLVEDLNCDRTFHTHVLFVSWEVDYQEMENLLWDEKFVLSFKRGLVQPNRLIIATPNLKFQECFYGQEIK